MTTLKTLHQLLEDASGTFIDTPISDIDSFFRDKLRDVGFVRVEMTLEDLDSEDDEDKPEIERHDLRLDYVGDDDIAYYDLSFLSSPSISISFIPSESEHGRPRMVLLSDYLTREVALDHVTVDEDGGILLKELPINPIKNFIAEITLMAKRKPLSEIFVYVVRKGKKVKKRVVRRIKKRMSPKQKMALRKNRRKSHRASANRKRNKSLAKRKTLHLKTNHISKRYKLAS